MTDARDVSGLFEEEAMRWLPDVMRFALALTRDRSEAEDLVQDTFVAAQRAWHQFQRGTDARAWLFTIARHRFYRLHERADRQVATDSPELESLAAAAHTMEHGSTLAEQFERQELREAVRRTMYALPSVYREVAILVDWHDQSYEAVAGILGIPVGTVRSRLFRARRLLQQALTAYAEDAGLSPRATRGGAQT
ncbi:sigma-70 family RNA polymerase sigma factor [Gemmatimonas sp.]|jgi:RNA polymerase sigma-70 factor (ECF subfamily)|uniref:sigma-70 family RNA polymerase sigma factor n=1 Tax=Gemmatimonas sp. TaxID=1962908 RepID=UPI0022C35A6A|nr:sigma-70 family RNA polymerase sigma factor [Gemmatimonas sp.]MCZ8206370.1 sigma-70 family RNA polymerase sigma factor [Gemmatimonas sp.]